MNFCSHPNTAPLPSYHCKFYNGSFSGFFPGLVREDIVIHRRCSGNYSTSEMILTLRHSAARYTPGKFSSSSPLSSEPIDACGRSDQQYKPLLLIFANPSCLCSSLPISMATLHDFGIQNVRLLLRDANEANAF